MTEDIAGEKPGETWEERFNDSFDGLWLFLAFEYKSIEVGIAPKKTIKSFIAKEIQSAVEAERRRISEEAAYIESHKAFHCRFDELVKVINPKK